MNRLVIIGNGFDMAHGLKTSYMDFINWYWEKWMNKLFVRSETIIDDGLCKIERDAPTHFCVGAFFISLPGNSS